VADGPLTTQLRQQISSTPKTSSLLVEAEFPSIIVASSAQALPPLAM